MAQNIYDYERIERIERRLRDAEERAQKVEKERREEVREAEEKIQKYEKERHEIGERREREAREAEERREREARETEERIQRYEKETRERREEEARETEERLHRVEKELRELKERREEEAREAEETIRRAKEETRETRERREEEAREAERTIRRAKEETRETRERREEEAREAEETIRRAKEETRETRERREVEAREAEERIRSAAEEIRQTTLREYLGLCHEHLSKSITIQTIESRTTKGNPANAEGKLRPDYIQPWQDFLETQKEILERLYSNYSHDVMPRVFESRHFIEVLGKRVASKKLGSEQDLHNIHRYIVETPVTQILQHLQSQPNVSQEFGLAGGIEFENHLNSLNDNADEVAERLEAQSLHPSTPLRPVRTKINSQPDQVCVYTTVEGVEKPALIAEYKAPHKLTIPMLRSTLQPDRPKIDLNAVINRAVIPHREDVVASFEYHAEKIVAAVITQAFSYMVTSGTRYGYITTGEAFVFLYVNLDDDAKTVYYHLAEPKQDVKAQSEAFPSTDDFLYRTAVSQVLIFSILGVQSAQDHQEWQQHVIDALKTWQIDWDGILSEIPKTPESAGNSSLFTSEYRSRTFNLDFRVRSPINTRLRSKKTVCCVDPDSIPGDDQGTPPPTDDEAPPHQTPTRRQAASYNTRSRRGRSPTGTRSSHTVRTRAFCTQSCLQGLAQGGPLDPRCPNVAEHCEKGHRGDQHPIDCKQFRMLLCEQLQQRRGEGCRPVGIQGARGALFKVMLNSYGYIVAAKGTVRAFVEDLKHEGDVYQQLSTLQGVYVPVCLGNIDLGKPFYYDAGICIVHLMLLSWGGEAFDRSKQLESVDKRSRASGLIQAIDAIHRAGVLHKDIRIPNLLWNNETGQVMVIDFERSEIVKTTRCALLPVSPNRKRKRQIGQGNVEGENGSVYQKPENSEMQRREVMDASVAWMIRGAYL